MINRSTLVSKPEDIMECNTLQRGEIECFFDSYRSAFSLLSTKKLLAHYSFPFFLRYQDKSQIFAHQEWAEKLESALRIYKDRDLSKVNLRTLSIQYLSHELMYVYTYLELVNSNNAVFSKFNNVYQFTRGDKDALKIFGIISVNEI